MRSAKMETAVSAKLESQQVPRWQKLFLSACIWLPALQLVLAYLDLRGTVLILLLVGPPLYLYAMFLAWRQGGIRGWTAGIATAIVLLIDLFYCSIAGGFLVLLHLFGPIWPAH